MLRWLARRRFAVASCLVATSLSLSGCDTLRSAVGDPGEAARKPPPARAPARPIQPAAPVAPPLQPPPPLTETIEPVAPETVKVALVLPLSGRLANLGRAMSDAAQMAMFDLADRRLELQPMDDKGTPAGSADAARQAAADGTQLIIGPLLAASVRAVAPVSTAAGIPVVAFSSDRNVAAPGVYIVGFTPDAEVERVVSYAVRGGLTRFGVLAPDNLYGTTVVDALRRAAAANGASVTRVQLYDATTQDFAPVVRKLANLPDPAAAAAAAAVPPTGSPTALPPSTLPPPAVPTLPQPRPPFDALLLAEGGAQLRAMAAAATVAGVGPPAVQLLGTGKWDEPGVGTEPALVGAWFAGPPPSGRDEFESRFKRVFGQAAPRLATLAYDATALAAVLGRGPQAQPFSESALTDPNGFFGRDGLFRLNADGTAERRLAILRVERTGVAVIDEPPRSFAAGS